MAFRWTIAQKVFWGYMIVIFLAVGLTLYAILRFQALNDLTASVLQTDLELITQARRLRADLLSEVRNEKQFGVTADRDFLELARQKGAEVQTRTRMLLDRALGESVRQPLLAFAQQHNEYESTLERMVSELDQRSRQSLPSLPALESRLDGYFEAMRGRLNDVLAAAEEQAAKRMSESDTLARHASQVLLGLCVAAGLLALVIAVGMTRHIGRPLRELRLGTFRIARGDFNRPVPVSGEDELSYLARSFNRMAEELRSLEETKTEFFSAISHELRTPLTSVREALQLMLDGIPGPVTEEQKKLLRIAREGNDKILRLINDLLKLAQLEADMMKLTMTPWRVESLIDAALEEIRPIALKASVGIEKEVPDGLPAVNLDGVKIQGVLANLLNNAVKFTPAGGEVRVRARFLAAGGGGGAIRISVSDTGVGVPEADREKIFDKFYRSVNAENRQGAGLGLPIAKRIVESHGGRIWVEPRGDGSRGAESPGSTFVFEIPVAEARTVETGLVSAGKSGSDTVSAAGPASRKSTAA